MKEPYQVTTSHKNLEIINAISNQTLTCISKRISLLAVIKQYSQTNLEIIVSLNVKTTKESANFKAKIKELESKIKFQ